MAIFLIGNLLLCKIEGVICLTELIIIDAISWQIFEQQTIGQTNTPIYHLPPTPIALGTSTLHSQPKKQPTTTQWPQFQL